LLKHDGQHVGSGSVGLGRPGLVNIPAHSNIS
jgi:hypothetical protein